MSNPNLAKLCPRDLVKEEAKATNLNDLIVQEIRSIDPRCDQRLTDGVIASISNNLSKGVPFEACCDYLGIPQGTVKRWIAKGKEEICNLTDEQLDSTDDPATLLTNYGKFVMEINKSRAYAILDITDTINGKMKEAHNEWMLTWMLERLDPETYNLKYKTAVKQNVNVNSGTQNIINVQFINGLSERPEEDQKFIKDSLENLKQIHPDEVVNNG